MKEPKKVFRIKKVRPTAMRELVLEILSQQDFAISLSDLEEQFDKADRSTLYRTLKTFVEKKVIHSIDDGTGTTKYAICNDNCACSPSELHLHFYCTKCEKTYCLADFPIPEIVLPAGYKQETANFVIKGICENCNKIT